MSSCSVQRGMLSSPLAKLAAAATARPKKKRSKLEGACHRELAGRIRGTGEIYMRGYRWKTEPQLGGDWMSL